MKEKLNSLEIKDKIANGELTRAEAVEMFQSMHEEPIIKSEVIPFRRESGLASLRRVTGEIFNHNNADLHYEQRMDFEEGIRHMVGMPIYGAIAAVDAALDAASFGFTEIVEDATFLASRTIYRARDGWERGKIK